MYIPNFNFLAQFGGKIGEEQNFFEVRKGGNHISPHLIYLVGWFLDILYNFCFSVDWLKKGQILCFWPLSAPSPNWGITEFWLQFIPTDMYLIRRPIEPIDRIEPILVRVKQSKWI